MPEPEFEKGVWVCPICGFKAMSKKVVMTHMEREHPEAIKEKPKEENKPAEKEEKAENAKKKKGSVSKRKFKLGKTEIRLWDYEYLEMKDQKGWLMFQNRNYTATLHKKQVRVKLLTGEEFEGLIKTRDPFFVSLVTKDGRKLIIHKGAIAYIELLPGGEPT